MKALTVTLLVGTAVAAVPAQQKVLNQEPIASGNFPFPLHEIQDKLSEIPADVKVLWNEVIEMFPDVRYPSVAAPKRHNRRPDSEWDYILRGADVQSIWVHGANGEEERELEGKLDTYDLRVKAVDPSVLGVDPDVKQYSGYLDDNQNDKHLFYCEIFLSFII